MRKNKYKSREEANLMISLKAKERFKDKSKHPMFAKHHSKTTKEKMRIKAIGRKLSEEAKRKIGLAHIGNKYCLGYKHSMEAKRNMSLSGKGRIFTEEHKRKISEAVKLLHNTLPNYAHHNKKTSQETKEKLSLMRLGNKNPSWLGGKSFEKYDDNFNKRFKKLVRKRDNYICLLCNKHQESLGRTLSVHHVNYDKNLSIMENCISLCVTCHAKTNINRESWIKFFQDILSNKYGYKYENSIILININGVKNDK